MYMRSWSILVLRIRLVEHVKDSVGAQHLQLSLQIWMGIDECGNLIHNRNELLMKLIRLLMAPRTINLLLNLVDGQLTQSPA